MACAGVGDYVHAMGIKQEKLSEHDYRLPLYPGGLGKSTELLEVTVSNNQNLLVHDLNMGNVSNERGLLNDQVPIMPKAIVVEQAVITT